VAECLNKHHAMLAADFVSCYSFAKWFLLAQR
jgi:hypothetical protein